MSVIEKPVICGACPAGCAIIATIDNGKLVKTRADLSNPYGALCVRGRATPEIIYSRDRLTKPLMRTGKRGEGEFRNASWDEAFDKITYNMQEIKRKNGAQAMVYHSGRGELSKESDKKSSIDKLEEDRTLKDDSPQPAEDAQPTDWRIK